MGGTLAVMELTCSTLDSNALEVNVNACSAPIPPATDYHPLLITSLHYSYLYDDLEIGVGTFIEIQ